MVLEAGHGVATVLSFVPVTTCDVASGSPLMNLAVLSVAVANASVGTIGLVLGGTLTVS